MSYVLAFDLGASSGRAMLGQLHQDKIELQDIHRFSNDPVLINGRLYWDILRLFHEIKQGLIKANQLGIRIDSIAIDSWAVDVGYLDDVGQLLANPFHYRDSQNNEAYKAVVEKLGASTLYEKTGIQLLSFNTLFQLVAQKEQHSVALQQAKHVLMIPSLLRYFLTGQMVNEFTNATTTQLLNASTKAWDEQLVALTGLKTEALGRIVAPGTIVGELQPSICEELGMSAIKVVATAEHDTAAAVAAVPTQDEHFVYISSGTWSLMGTEIRSALLTEEAASLNFTNEGGVDDTYRLLKNIMGLWMIQECKREWDSNGEQYTFAELVQLAEAATPFKHLLDVDDAMFLGTGQMLERIDSYCERTGQAAPKTVGEYARAIYEGLALKYRYTLEQIEHLTGKYYTAIHIVGGGSQNARLCQWTANVTGRKVVAGPVEASTLGNMLVQWLANGKIGTLAEGRLLISESFTVQSYNSQEQVEWDEQYRRYSQFVKNH